MFIFLTDSYQAVISSIVGSHDVLPLGMNFDIGDLSRLAVEAAGKRLLARHQDRSALLYRNGCNGFTLG